MELKEKIENVKEEIKFVYKNCSQPWVIGYSGGKDSSCTLQLIWQAIAELPLDERNRQIHVIFSDTLVETPVISMYLQRITKVIDQAAKDCDMPITVTGVFPKMEDSFWVNMIGKGYPAPTIKFRWCTDRLKIQPANKFILDVVAKHGEAIMVLGARSEESGSRAQILKKAKEGIQAGEFLSTSNTLPSTYVYTPISDWTTAEVWEYLLMFSKTPWGTSNRDLAAMYKNSTASECPLVVDKSTPSCGNSRFGCWTCTVVEKDNSLSNMIDNGMDCLEPMLDFRNMLYQTTIPENKHKYRSHRRRRGYVSFMNNTEDVAVIRGPYTVESKRNFLKMLLEAQVEINKRLKGKEKVELIKEEELKLIRRVWIAEDNDWEDNVSKIYKEVMGKDFNESKDDSAHFGIKELQLLDEICRENGVPTDLVARLIDKEREFSALGRRSTLNKELDSILKREWRSEEEVVEEQKKKLDYANK